MNIEINYLLTDGAVEWSKLAPLASLLSPRRQQRLATFLHDDDRVACLLAELLVRQSATEKLGIEADSIEFHIDSFGKPHLAGFPDFHFSISHTDGCVAVATGHRALGLDVERHAAANPAIARRFFTPREVQRMEESRDPSLAFYDIWTKKEAYLKMLGTGLTRPLNSFDVFSDELHFFTRQLPGYTMNLCVGDDHCAAHFLQRDISWLLAAFHR